eukprot:g17436.t1
MIHKPEALSAAPALVATYSAALAHCFWPHSLVLIPFPNYVIGTDVYHDLWLLSFPLKNPEDSIRDIPDPGTREATYHPGVSL